MNYRDEKLLMMSIEANDINPYEALYMASYYDHIEIVKMLFDVGITNLNNALEGAIKRGRVRIVKLLLKKRCY